MRRSAYPSLKTALWLLLALCSAGQATDIIIPEERKLPMADWAGTGKLGEKAYFKEVQWIPDWKEHVWKITLHVDQTLKGATHDTIEFYFESGEDPSRNPVLQRLRCPPYPEVKDHSKVKVYLKLREIDGAKLYFLENNQLIEALPSTNLAPTPGP